jgi:hypothetical protein
MGKEPGMRIAAGILMVAFALFMVTDAFSGLSQYGIYISDLALGLLQIIPAAFIVSGGVFCLARKYWRVCFASTVVTVVIMVIWWIGQTDSVLAWLGSMLGTFPIIFVLLKKSEWQASQA